LQEIAMTPTPSLRNRATALAAVAAFSALLLVLAGGCSQAPDNSATDPAPGTDSSDTVSADVRYICPMHPHIQQHGPGSCPVCGMELVKKQIEANVPATSVVTKRALETQRQALYWYDPMRPEVKFDAPGKSPFMDMQLVPKYGDDRADANGGIRIDPTVVQNLGIRTVLPIRRDVQATVRVPARVVADARGQARLQSRAKGWIEKLHVRAAGQYVAAGSVIAEIHSPELVQAQEELLLGPDSAAGAAERLRRLGIADADIEQVKRAGKSSRRLPLRAPVSGVVTELGVREGSSVSADTLIADISARDALWVEAQLFPSQMLRLGKSLQATFSLPDLPERRWKASGGTVVPVADPITQTIAVRFALDNSGDALPLGTQLDAQIRGATTAGVLLVPVSAVIRTAQGARVLVEVKPGVFTPTPVMLGLRDGSDIEIRDGLIASQRIVVSGQFLLDAEASLQAGLAQMTPAAEPAIPESEHDHD